MKEWRLKCSFMILFHPNMNHCTISKARTRNCSIVGFFIRTYFYSQWNDVKQNIFSTIITGSISDKSLKWKQRTPNAFAITTLAWHELQKKKTKGQNEIGLTRDSRVEKRGKTVPQTSREITSVCTVSHPVNTTVYVCMWTCQ